MDQKETAQVAEKADMPAGDTEAITVSYYHIREAWLEARAALPTWGASVVPSLFNANPFCSQFAAIADKISGSDSCASAAATWGLDLESCIAKHLARKHGLEFVPTPGPYVIWRNPEIPHLHATTDFLVSSTDNGERTSNFQIKNVGRNMAARWDAGPPDNVLIQVQAEMAASGLEHTYIGAQLGGEPPVLFEAERNDRFIAAIHKLTDKCWQFVETKCLPEIGEIAVASTQAALKALHPNDNGQEIELDACYDAYWQTLEMAQRERALAEKAIDYLNAVFHRAIGDATYGRSPSGQRWSLKTTTRKAYQVAETTYRTLRKAKG